MEQPPRQPRRLLRIRTRSTFTWSSSMYSDQKALRAFAVQAVQTTYPVQNVQDVYTIQKHQGMYAERKAREHPVKQIFGAIKRSFFHNLDEWCELTPWHCIINVYRSKRIICKLLWLIVVMFSSFLAVYQCSMLLSDFLTGGQWVTSVSYERPTDGGLDWPNISVCNLNEDFQSKFDKQNVTGPYEIAMMQTMTTEGMSFYQKYQSDESEEDLDNQTLTNMAKNYSSKYDYTVSDLLLRTIPGCQDTVVHCGQSNKFRPDNGIPPVGPTGCCDGKSQIRWRSCFSLHPTFTFGKSTINVRGSDDAGIFYLLDPNVKDSYDKMILYKKPSAGLRIQMYYGTLEASNPETVLLTPGTHTVVAITPQKNKMDFKASDLIPFYERQKPCIEDPGFKYKYVADGNAYAQPLCQADCGVDFEIHMCNCTIRTVRQKVLRECRGSQIRVCQDLGNTDSNLDVTFPDGFNYRKCVWGCREACSYQTIVTKTTQSQFPAPTKVDSMLAYLRRAFPNKIYDEELVKQLIFLQISYQSTEYEVVTKMERSSAGQVVSDIGGALGVWTGLSILSMFQAVTYATLFFYQLCRQLALLCWRKEE